MYTDFYGLRADPFRMSPDHNFCFRHASFSKAKAYMRYALHREEGFVLITGEPGTGKTTLIGDLISDFNQTDFDIAKLVGAKLEGDDLLRMVSHAFRVPVIGAFKSEILNHLHRYITDIHKRKRRPLLIVDEAQGLAGEALEELRLLTNLQNDGQPLLQIFLVGQSELRDLILDPAVEQLHQRIVAACHLEPLKPLDTAAYVVHRLKCTGWVGRPMIDIEIFPDLYNFSRGIPRRINLAFSRLLLNGTLEEKNWLDASDIRLVVEELCEEDLFPGKPSAEIELNDFDINELLSLVQPDKSKVTPELAVPETSSQVSPTVAVSREEQLAAIPDTQLIASPTPESEHDKLEAESASSDNADQEDMSSPVAQKDDRKMAGVETLADRSKGEFRDSKPDLTVYENTKKQKKAVEDTSFSCTDTSRNPGNWWVRRRAVAVSLTGGLVLTVGILLIAPSYQLNRMVTDNTWSQLGVKQARDLLTRFSGGNLPIRYDSELQQPVISDLEKPATAIEKQNIEHHPESRELANIMYESGSAQSEPVDRNQATPLPVKTEKPNNTVLPKEPEPKARKAIAGEDNREPGGQLIATKDKKTPYTIDASNGLRQQDGNFPVGPSFATVGEVSFELGSAEKDFEQQPMLNGIAASQTPSDEHKERVGDPSYTERPSEHRAVGADRYLVDREYKPNNVLAEASIPETQSEIHSPQPLVEAQQPVDTNSNEVLEAAKTNLNLHDRNATADSMTELAPKFDIEPVVAQAAGSDEKAKTAKIEKLLILGEQAVTRNRLRYPKDQSAWYYYSKVIELDPGNQAAERGLQKIAERYARLVSNLMVKQQYAKARTYVNRGLGILPENTELRTLKQELDNHYAELLRLQNQDAQALAVAASRSRTKPAESEPSDILSKLKRNILSGKTQTPEQFFQANDH